MVQPKEDGVNHREVIYNPGPEERREKVYFPKNFTVKDCIYHSLARKFGIREPAEIATLRLYCDGTMIPGHLRFR